jgi:hypothetical protein
VQGLYVAVATLTSSILDPDLTITDSWLKVVLRIEGVGPAR